MSTPKSKLLILPAFVAKNGVGSFLEPKDLCAVAQTCRQQSDLYKHNCKASELLFYGLNINKARKKKLLELLTTQKQSAQRLSKSNLSQTNLLQKLLSRLNLSGQHLSQSKTNLSQRNGAGENFSQNSQSSQNSQNSQKSQNSQSSQNSQYSDVRSVILTRVNGRQVYYSLNLNDNACMRIYSNVSPLEAAVLCGDFHLVRLLLENLPDNQKQGAVLQLKKIREQLDTDPRSFVSLIITLQKLYKDLIDNEKLLWTQKNEFARRNGLLGENQKTLPWFILQSFCNPGPNKPIPDLRQEPERECILYRNIVLDLDSIGSDSKCALIKGDCDCGLDECECGEPRQFARTGSALSDIVVDSAAINGLCTVIKSELDKIIKLQEQKLLLAAYPNPVQSVPTQAPSPSSSPIPIPLSKRK